MESVKIVNFNGVSDASTTPSEEHPFSMMIPNVAMQNANRLINETAFSLMNLLVFCFILH